MRQAIVLLGLLVACGACHSALVPPTDEDARKAAERWPGTTRADLEHGRTLYIARCGGCHALVIPSDEAPARWPKILNTMAARSKLNDPDREAIERYLVTLSER